MKIIRIILLVGAMLLVTGGCGDKRTGVKDASGPPATRPASTMPASEFDGQAADPMDFFDGMVRKAKCSVADAVRAVVLLEHGEDVGTGFEDRYDFLVERDIVRPAWRLKADQWIDRGTLAFMLLRVARVPGGVNMSVFGSWGLGDRRYAYREMLYNDLMPPGCDYNYVSGPELITTLGKVDNYMARGKNSPAEETDLGNEPQSPAP